MQSGGNVLYDLDTKEPALSVTANTCLLTPENYDSCTSFCMILIAHCMQNGGYAVYNFDTKEPALGVPDVLLTVKASPAAVAMYCNPSWVTVRDEANKIAGPLNAIFQFGARLAETDKMDLLVSFCPPMFWQTRALMVG